MPQKFHIRVIISRTVKFNLNFNYCYYYTSTKSNTLRQRTKTAHGINRTLLQVKYYDANVFNVIFMN